MVRGAAAVIGLGVTAAVAAKLLRRSRGQPHHVDINSADPEALQRILHIGPGRASRIIALRSAQPFASLEELQARVEGIGPAVLAQILEQGLASVGPQARTDS
jgi:DNA uptake protein ComE-like DNA-binding protein